MTLVTKKEREWLLGQQGKVIWITGLPCSGKTTIAYELEKKCIKNQILTCVLDGDNIRKGICSDLGFSEEDRKENIRRVGAVAEILASQGIWVIISIIGPYMLDRLALRKKLWETRIRLTEVYLSTSVAVCERRDIKGMYKLARKGQIADFTGIDGPYEPPPRAEITIDTKEEDVETSVNRVFKYLQS